jgi:hypothetical protein
MRSSHYLLSLAQLLGFASALGAFRAAPGTPHLELLPSGRALKALHPSQEAPSKYTIIILNLINLYENQNSCERRVLVQFFIINGNLFL